ncbi:hypothetical protein GCM10010193_35460 [Kitasatospora atroaurantiaca]
MSGAAGVVDGPLPGGRHGRERTGLGLADVEARHAEAPLRDGEGGEARLEKGAPEIGAGFGEPASVEVNSQALYQLSYRPCSRTDRPGLEPGTAWSRSNPRLRTGRPGAVPPEIKSRIPAWILWRK